MNQPVNVELPYVAHYLQESEESRRNTANCVRHAANRLGLTLEKYISEPHILLEDPNYSFQNIASFIKYIRDQGLSVIGTNKPLDKFRLDKTFENLLLLYVSFILKNLQDRDVGELAQDIYQLLDYVFKNEKQYIIFVLWHSSFHFRTDKPSAKFRDVIFKILEEKRPDFMDTSIKMLAYLCLDVFKMSIKNERDTLRATETSTENKYGKKITYPTKKAKFSYGKKATVPTNLGKDMVRFVGEKSATEINKLVNRFTNQNAEGTPLAKRTSGENFCKKIIQCLGSEYTKGLANKYAEEKGSLAERGMWIEQFYLKALETIAKSYGVVLDILRKMVVGLKVLPYDRGQHHKELNVEHIQYLGDIAFVQTPGDKHCFYHSVSYNLCAKLGIGFTLKLVLSYDMLMNQRKYEQIAANSKIEFNKLLLRAFSPGLYADVAVALCTAEMLKRPIFLYGQFCTGNKKQVFSKNLHLKPADSKEKQQPIMIAYVKFTENSKAQNHFVALMKKKDEVGLPPPEEVYGQW